MSDEPAQPMPSLDEQLVAYLDGELDAESGRRIEALLASDADVRRRLQSLERTWDLLDELDGSALGEPFTRTTLEMVAVAAHEDVQRREAEAPRRRRWRLLALGAAMLVAAATAFFGVILLADPNRFLLDNLPMLENFDAYRQAGGVEFLRMLHGERLFAGGGGDRHAAAAVRGEPSASPREQVRAMSGREKEELLRAESHFADLDAAARQNLWKLHDDLRLDPDGPVLRDIMRRYHEWLRGLPSYTRAELTEMEPADRIAAIKKRLNAEQAREGGRRPGGRDMDALMKWMSELATRHEKELSKSLPKSQRKHLAEVDEPLQSRMTFWAAWQRSQAAQPGKPPAALGDADMAALRTRLGPEARKRLESLPSGRQWQLVMRWLAMHHGFAARDSYDKRLAEFFEKEISDDDRDWLLGLPGEEMQQQLQRLFLTRSRPGRPDEHGRGRWPNGWLPRGGPPPDRPPPGHGPPDHPPFGGPPPDEPPHERE